MGRPCSHAVLVLHDKFAFFSGILIKTIWIEVTWIYSWLCGCVCMYVCMCIFSWSWAWCPGLGLWHCVINSSGPECRLSLEMSLYWLGEWMGRCFHCSPTLSVLLTVLLLSLWFNITFLIQPWTLFHFFFCFVFVFETQISSHSGIYLFLLDVRSRRKTKPLSMGQM